MLRTYTLSRQGVRRLLWKSARLSFAVTVLLIAIALSLPFGERETRHTTGWVLLYLSAVVVLCTWLAARSTRRSWEDFRLELDDDSLQRTQHRLPPVTVHRAEVTRVEEIRDRGLVVYTNDSERFIFVPAALTGYDELRAELDIWAPVIRLSAATTWRRQWFGIASALTLVGWMVATMASGAVIFVVPSSFAISVFLLWAFVAAQRSLHLAPRAKRGMWLVVFPILGLTLKSTYLLARLSLP